MTENKSKERWYCLLLATCARSGMSNVLSADSWQGSPEGEVGSNFGPVAFPIEEVGRNFALESTAAPESLIDLYQIYTVSYKYAYKYPLYSIRSKQYSDFLFRLQASVFFHLIKFL
jgi:hypothetical protein